MEKEESKPKVRPAQEMAVSEISIFQRFGPAILVIGGNDIAIQALDLYDRYSWADAFTHTFLGMAFARLFQGLKIWSVMFLFSVSVCIEVLQFYFKTDYGGIKDSIEDITATILGYLFIQALCLINSKSGGTSTE